MSFQHWPAARASYLTLLAFVASLALIGCASPGDPVPRQHPIIPIPVQDLEARQQGNEITLTFTLPNRTTANEPLAAPPAIEIYRSDSVPIKPKEKKSPKLVYTIPSEMVNSYQQDGRIVYKEDISPDELNSANREIRSYEIRTREARNRASAESNRVQVVLNIPPARIEGLQAQLLNRAVALKWMPAPQNDPEYRVYRAEISPSSAAAATNDSSKAEFISPLRLLARPSLANYADQNVELGHTYMYIVRQAAGAGGAELESADSKPAVITPMQVAPPAAPQGLEAVSVPATSGSPGYISLSWDIGTENNIAGYFVYRSEQAQTRGERLNQELLPTPTYRDTSAVSGKRYFYRVTAADEANDESEPGPPVEAQLGVQP